LTLVTLVLHTAGLVFRMVLEGRPPVTNLYSSAVFIGWGACILGLLLERFWKNGIGLIASSTAGFTTLIIAHNLAQSGDTMEMMRAVLDTNFWLATHVVIVTLGYSATFVAGLLAVLYVVLGFFTRSLARESAQALSKMVYGIICFAALFSFIGTVLGGIWADQSWGRFWGWDAKENGALMIVLWNAIFLHARWGGMARERGLMALAIGGNIITAWSWFGVNMLGIGLHAYGFMSAAFNWLMLFVATQLVLAILALVPQRFWRSQPA
jgi:ABC-type transport system involved in cytochrome c biogenesis permease subunit